MIQVRRHIKLLRKLEFTSTNLRHETTHHNLKDKADILQPYGITVNKSVQT
jgi:hypothetical protein